MLSRGGLVATPQGPGEFEAVCTVEIHLESSLCGSTSRKRESVAIRSNTIPRREVSFCYRRGWTAGIRDQDALFPGFQCAVSSRLPPTCLSRGGGRKQGTGF